MFCYRHCLIAMSLFDIFFVTLNIIHDTGYSASVEIFIFINDVQPTKPVLFAVKVEVVGCVRV